MQILNIAGYKFISLSALSELRSILLEECNRLGLKGTILLSAEGINISLAGAVAKVEQFRAFLKKDERFVDLSYRESYSDFVPFKRMKVKLKKEIITMRRPEICPEAARASEISPQEFKRWLDENRDITILDTRNDYEVRFGTFHNAVNLHIDDFCEFPNVAESIAREKPIVMFCTGGVRCEKAAIHLKNSGFSDVYQLDGGILNYFAQVGGEHYDGECFVFDERVAVDAKLQTTGTRQCLSCNGPIAQAVTSCESCQII